LRHNKHMAKYMMTVRLDPKEATLARVRRKLKLKKDEIDPVFGVVSLDLDANLYAILVDEAAAARLTGSAGVSSPYANPPIEPFGPPSV
jgi:hypothetical protein